MRKKKTLFKTKYLVSLPIHHYYLEFRLYIEAKAIEYPSSRRRKQVTMREDGYALNRLSNEAPFDFMFNARVKNVIDIFYHTNVLRCS